MLSANGLKDQNAEAYDASLSDFVLIFSLGMMSNFLGQVFRPEVHDNLTRSRTLILGLAFMAMVIAFIWFQKQHHIWDMLIVAVVAFVWFVAITRLYLFQIFAVLIVLACSLTAHHVQSTSKDSITEHYAQLAQLGFTVIAAALTAYWAIKNGPGQVF